MKGFFKLVNFFLTTLNVDLGTGSTGTLTITDKIVDGYTLVDGTYKFHIIVDLPNKSSREIFRVWKVVGNILHYDKRISPSGVSTHLAGAMIQINDISEMLNTLSNNVDMFGYTEIKTGLTVTCYGGNINYNNTKKIVSDIDIIITDNSVTNIGLDFIDGLIKVVSNLVTFKGYLLSEVTSAGGVITSVIEKREISLGVEFDPTFFVENTGLVKILGASIGTNELSNLGVTSAKLAVDSVITTKVLNLAITNAKIADGAISNIKLDTSLQSSITLANKIVDNGNGIQVLHNDGTYKDVYGVASGTLSSKIVTQSATPILPLTGTRSFSITGLAQDIISMTSGLTGTPTEGDMIRIDITDNGTSRNIFWGTSYENSGITLPLKTVAGIRMDLAMLYNSATSKWRCVGLSGVGSLPLYSITNTSIDRVLDTNATTIGEIANVLGTLITDIDGISKGPQGLTGNGIQSVTKTSGNGAAGTTDTYTILFTDGTNTTFDVLNGANGINGTGLVNSISGSKNISIDNTDITAPKINFIIANTTVTSIATPTPNVDTSDIFTITGLALGATIGAPVGTPVEGQKLCIRIKDNATAQTLAWNAIYRAGDIALPTTTIINKTMYVGFIYNSTDTKWDLIAYIDNI